MILDELNEIADAATIPVTATTEVVCGDVIPLKNTTNYPSAGCPVYFTIRIAAQVTSGSSSTTIFRIRSSSSEDVADGAATPTEHWVSSEIAKATLAPGYVVYQGTLPLGAYKKYLGVTTYSSHTLTGGTADIVLTHDVNAWRAYADAL